LGEKLNRIVYTAHAAEVMRQREIAVDWVERVLESPERTEPDPGFPRRQRAFARIGEYGDRWLRVVYETDSDVWTVVTVFFDRNAGR
jgi:Domain of unknown function (DUF4258)